MAVKHAIGGRANLILTRQVHRRVAGQVEADDGVARDGQFRPDREYSIGFVTAC
jgi:hypothetical protein